MYSHGPCSHHMSAAQRCKLVFNAVFNAMRTLLDLSYKNLPVSKLYQNCINTAIIVKLLTSKVTLLNTCEKLKMPHEKQLDLANIKSKVNETCYCETCLSQLVKMRKRMRNGADPRSGCGTDMGIKCVIMSFSPHFYVSVFLIYVIL